MDTGITNVSSQELVEASVAEVHVNGCFAGSGFFVLPDGHLVTCAHVLCGDAEPPYSDSDLPNSIEVVYRGDRYVARIVHEACDLLLDTAVLSVDVRGTCQFCPLDLEWKAFDRFFVYGFQRYTAGYRGFPVKGTLTGRTQQHAPDQTRWQTLLVLESPNMEAGLSGAPILNLRTGKVVGIVKRDMPAVRGDMLVGGYAVPVSTIFNCFRSLRKQNTEAQVEHHTPLRNSELLKYLVRQGLFVTTEKYNMRCIYPMTDEFSTNVRLLEGTAAKTRRVVRMLARAVARRLPEGCNEIVDPALLGYGSVDERRLIQAICRKLDIELCELDYRGGKAAIAGTMSPGLAQNLGTYLGYLEKAVLLLGPDEREILRLFGEASYKVTAVLSTDALSKLCERDRWKMIDG